MDLDILHSTVRISTPLILAALGGLLTYQAGMLNIALDGFMIVAAFTGIAAAYFSGSLLVAIVAAAALFGALDSGSVVLQMTTGLSKYLVEVLQFLTVLILAARFSWDWLRAGGRGQPTIQLVGVVNEPDPKPSAEEA